MVCNHKEAYKILIKDIQEVLNKWKKYKLGEKYMKDEKSS